MELDYHTMVFLLGFTSFLTVVLFLSYMLITRTHVLSLGCFALSKFIETLGIFCIAFRHELPPFISLEVSNLLLTLGIAWEAFTVTTYQGEKQKRIFLTFSFFALISSLLFTYNAENYYLRYTISAVSAALLTLVASIVLIVERKQYKFPLLMAISYLIYAIGRLSWPVSVWLNEQIGEVTSFQPVDLIGLFVSTSSIIGAIGFLFLLKEVESQEIHSKDQLINTVLDQIPVAIIQTDLEANIQYVNPQFSKLSGYTPKEIIGQNARILNAGKTKDSTYSTLWETIQCGEIWHGSFINKRKNNSEYLQEASITPITDYNGNITSYLAIANDITERITNQKIIAEKNTQLTELNVSKNKLFSVIAHDLRSPLGNVPNLLELVKQHITHNNTEKAIYITDVLITNSNNIFQLLENLLHWSRTQLNTINMQPSEFQLNEILEDIIDLFSVNIRQKKITVQYDALTNISVYTDIDAIRTVLRNLLSNAIKFSPESGHITITTQPHGNKIAVAIQDNGVGIPPEKLPQLFTLTENESTQGTQGEKGTGLGLIITSDFVTKNNGEMWIESEVNKGSTFYFTIPLHP